jgi:hypothetical protein
MPFVVCVVRASGVEMLLANSTLINKLSHSSHNLTRDRVRGSFNGTNILRHFDELENEPAHFDELFDRHLRIGFEENYARIVENTLSIKGRGTKFVPKAEAQSRILAAADLAAALLRDQHYLEFQSRVTQTVERNQDAILSAATSDNVNLRGNAIEQIITSAGNLHRAEDVVEVLPSGITVALNIKSKMLGYSSNPAAYNIDKVLRLLSSGDITFSLLLVGIDRTVGSVRTQMVSFLDSSILGMTRIQPHWAGRNSRGNAQLAGDLSGFFAPTFQESVDVRAAKKFLQRLIDL